MIRKQLIPYLTAGYPTRAATLDLMKACADGGADQVELGIPFSDPLADGPAIQASSQRALENGMTPREAISIAGRFRETPVLLMTYFNPVLQDRSFFARAADARVAGVVIPDLPPEEGAETRGVPLIPLCAPTCSDERLGRIARQARSFIYMVSRRGVTGERAAVTDETSSFVRRARKLTRKPLCVGFGISTPEQARHVARIADGVIVGSAIVKRSSSPRELRRFVASLRRAIDES